VQLIVQGIPAKLVTVKEYRIDKQHSNSYEVWKQMGSPQLPSPEQIKELEKAGQLKQTDSVTDKTAEGEWRFTTSLPRQGVALYVITWK
jgi:xylan 1,4-beta-xylosidase